MAFQHQSKKNIHVLEINSYTALKKRPIIHPLFPESGSDLKSNQISPKVASKRQRKNYRRSVLHRAALDAASSNLPPPKNGSLRQAASACAQRLQADAVSTQSAKKRPLPNSPGGPSPSHFPPLAQKIRKDIQIGESEVDSPEKEVLRGPPFLENSPAPFSPCSKDIPSPAPLVFTPEPPETSSLNCLNCDARMTPDHQCKDTDSEGNWEDIESDQELYPTLDLDHEDWINKFTNDLRRFHGIETPLTPSEDNVVEVEKT